jgi:DNA-binding IclR family transcriptional regulator
MAAAGKVQSIERAIKIINCFSERTPELKLTEIADMLDLNKSTIHGIINTLKDGGLIDQNEENQKYRLGLNLVHYAAQVLKSLDIRRVAEPVIRQLCDEVNETVHLGVLDGKEIVYIDKMESNQSIRIFTSIGTRYHAYCTAIGKSILSDYSNEAIERLLPDVLPQYTKTTKTSKAAILAEIDEVRHTGYALDLEENVEGLKCVGAPIYNHEGHVKYSISVSGPIQRMTDEKTAMIIERVKIAAQEISKKIGYIQ